MTYDISPLPPIRPIKVKSPSIYFVELPPNELYETDDIAGSDVSNVAPSVSDASATVVTPLEQNVELAIISINEFQKLNIKRARDEEEDISYKRFCSMGLVVVDEYIPKFKLGTRESQKALIKR